MAVNYERLQDRGDADDPPLPVDLVRGTAGSVLDPVAVHPVEVRPDSSPTPAEQVDAVAESITARLPDLPPTEDPVLARLRAWQPEM